LKFSSRRAKLEMWSAANDFGRGERKREMTTSPERQRKIMARFFSGTVVHPPARLQRPTIFLIDTLAIRNRHISLSVNDMNFPDRHKFEGRRGNFPSRQRLAPPARDHGSRIASHESRLGASPKLFPAKEKLVDISGLCCRMAHCLRSFLPAREVPAL
jgi:hypothetical protein